MPEQAACVAHAALPDGQPAGLRLLGTEANWQVVKDHVDAWNAAADDNDKIDMPNWEPAGNTVAAAETPEERAVDNVVITTADNTPNTPPEDDGLGGANTQAEEPDEEEAAGK